jgi:hypothetical protein
VLQVIADDVCGDVVLAIPAGIAGGHQNRPAAGVLSSLYIHCSISDHVAFFKIEIEIPGCPAQHTGAGFSVRTNHSILGQIGIFMMRTKIHGIDVCLIVSKHLPQPVMDNVNILFRAQPTGDYRLVCYYDDLQTCIVQQANAGGRAGEETKLVNTVEEVDFFIDDTVAVQEYSSHATMLS